MKKQARPRGRPRKDAPKRRKVPREPKKKGWKPLPDVSVEDLEEELSKRTVTLRQAMTALGLTEQVLLEKLKQELDATEVKAALDRKGSWRYSKPLIAWEVRQRARMDAHRIRGDYPRDSEPAPGTITIHMNFGAPDDADRNGAEI